ncbi:MAG: hypothetical protein JSS91_02465 [Bacteroidetes bacterium]|nr:hypothetical protein [Bacteroidota bacterium]
MDELLKPVKNICTFCQMPIKNDSEAIFCNSCSSPYHKDCWTENKGCAVYGCGEKIRDENEEVSIREAIINIEYLINRNQFSEAIFEGKQYLKLDRRNNELKNLYNKAVALINNKINLMTSGDEAFGNKDYKAAEIYYKNVLKYTDETETNFVNTRLDVIREKTPEQKRRRLYTNILIIVIIIAILSALGYLGYYTFILKEDRDYTELVKSDKANDLNSMEKMIGKYETFLRNYSDGKNKNRALDRIKNYSYQISSIYYKDDWKLALKYYNKIKGSIDPDDAKTLFNNIYNVAFAEYGQKISGAKKLNASGKYSESLNELNNAKLILTVFPETAMYRDLNILEANISLLSKKIASIVKYNDLERELREQDKLLINLTSSGNSSAITKIISARVTEKREDGIYLCKEPDNRTIIAIKDENENYTTGQAILVNCERTGDYKYRDFGKDIELAFYKVIPGDTGGRTFTNEEKQSILERINNLKDQKLKIDSLFKLNLL